jgi:ubiquinone/menaquinone biosynthesis C-methylase UbiE
MTILWLLIAFLVFQIGIRAWVRAWPQRIPYGWGWLLENPWRKHYRAPAQTVAEYGIKPSDTVLEIGAGSGLFSDALAASCAKLIVSDIEERYLTEAKVKTKHRTNLEFLVADACALPLPDASVNVVVMISVLPEISTPTLALREAARVLKPGGHIVISQELFEPEYVPPATTDAWAAGAGLVPIKKLGDWWIYTHHYAPG